MSQAGTRDRSARAATAARATTPRNGSAAGSGAPRRQLIMELAARFQKSPDSPELPLVVVNRMSQADSAHVVVIWDKWKDLTIPQRGRVIADAFAAANADEQAGV